MAAVSPYETAKVLARPAPNWVKNTDDALRVQVYDTYDDIYHNVKEAFAVVLRTGDDELSRRYVPSARTIIEATNRYLAKDPTFISSVPANVTVDQTTIDTTMALIDSIMTREEFGAKFPSLKRWMLIRGDAILHLSADPLKPEGSRIRINEIAPGNYFMISDDVDTSRVLGAYITTIVLDDDGGEIAQRIEYRRILNADDAGTYATPVGGVFYRIGYYEPDAWDDRFPLKAEDLKPVDVPSWATVPVGASDYITGFALPAEITAIPLYHFKNNRAGNEPYGLSELQGIESLLAGITQNVSDEDLTVALQGIGVYATDSGSPTDANGVEVDWEISPASVLELEDGKKFDRVKGVDTVQPFTDHISQLESQAQQTTGTPDVAVGRVDVQVVESGIALSISMNPLLSKNAEKEQEIGSKLDQFLYDLLNGWLPAYEGIPATGLVVKVMFGNPLPLDRVATVKEIIDLVTAKLISLRFGAQLLHEKLGYEIDPAAMVSEVQGEAAAALDAAAARIDQAIAPTPAPAAGGAVA